MSELILWLLLVYVAGTIIGYHFGRSGNIKSILEDFLDQLISEGYVKTRGKGDDLELLKHWEKE